MVLNINCLTCLSLLFAQVSSVYFMNSTFNWSGQIVTNFISDPADPTSLVTDYYLNVTDNGYGKLNAKSFTESAALPGASSSWVNTNSYQLLVNDYYQFLIGLRFFLSLPGWNGTQEQHSAIIVKYNDTQGQKQLSILLSLGYLISTTGNLTTGGLTYSNQTSVFFAIKTNPNLSDLQLCGQSNNPQKRQSYITQFDVIGLFKAMKIHYGIASDFTMTYINPVIKTNNFLGSIDLDISKELSQTKCCGLSTISLSNRSVSMMVTQNLMKPNYCKIFFNGSQLTAVVFGFDYQNLAYGLKSYQFVGFGYLSTKWVTPIGAYSLPISLTDKAQIFANFSFTFTQSVISTNYTVCFTITLRDDYNPITQSFNTTTKTNPSAQIFICPWWKIAPTDATKIKFVRLLGNQFYIMYFSSSSWPIYTFLPYNPTQDPFVQNFDLFNFVQQVVNYNKGITTHYIASVQMGFRAYSGAGKFSISQAGIQVNILPKDQGVVNADCLISNLVSSSGNSSQTQECGTGAVVFGTVNKVMSAPNLALIMKMVCFLRFVDDITYYAYHQNNYNSRFRGLSNLAWNLTASKWMIPQLAPFYESFHLTYKPTLSDDPTFLIPTTYVQFQQDANFLRQTQEFWISSLPLTIILFLFFHILYVILNCFKITKKISKLFVRFNWFGFLFVSIIGDNIQYLSFRGFSQLYQLLPINRTQIFTIVTSYLSLFCVIFYSASAYFILPVVMARNGDMMLEGFRQSVQSKKYLISVCVLKVGAGYVHSALCNYGLSQIMCLLIIQSTILMMLINNHSIYQCKTLFTCHMIENIFRMILHLLLCTEIYVGDQANPFKGLLEQLTWNFTAYIFLLCIADIIISNTVSGSADSEIKIITQPTKKSHYQLKDNNDTTMPHIRKTKDLLIFDKKRIDFEVNDRNRIFNQFKKQRKRKKGLLKKSSQKKNLFPMRLKQMKEKLKGKIDEIAL